MRSSTPSTPVSASAPDTTNGSVRQEPRAGSRRGVERH